MRYIYFQSQLSLEIYSNVVDEDEKQTTRETRENFNHVLCHRSSFIGKFAFNNFIFLSLSFIKQQRSQRRSSTHSHSAALLKLLLPLHCQLTNTHTHSFGTWLCDSSCRANIGMILYLKYLGWICLTLLQTRSEERKLTAENFFFPSFFLHSVPKLEVHDDEKKKKRGACGDEGEEKNF
jgi:hypothetical protein